jgi:hypothetical protein
MTMQFEGFDKDEARAFAAKWLPAWTGNDPKRLASFYHPDAFYSDPAIPGGVRGCDALHDYFVRLLRRYPDWVWQQVDSSPMPGGFLNKWRATIQVADGVLEVVGVCTVELRDGLIVRNEVYFDRTELLARSAKR